MQQLLKIEYLIEKVSNGFLAKLRKKYLKQIFYGVHHEHRIQYQ